MSQILVGTCGYSYTEWVGPVYPEGTPKEDYLRLYAAQFGTVELDFPYYRMPTAEQLGRMAETAPGLSFAVKAHESLTHKIDMTGWEGAAKTYLEALAPLREGDGLRRSCCNSPFRSTMRRITGGIWTSCSFFSRMFRWRWNSVTPNGSITG
jgi:hypothetical protein